MRSILRLLTSGLVVAGIATFAGPSIASAAEPVKKLPTVKSQPKETNTAGQKSSVIAEAMKVSFNETIVSTHVANSDMTLMASNRGHHGGHGDGLGFVAQGSRVVVGGGNDLFRNYYSTGTLNGYPMYPSPRTYVPPYVGHTYYTYPPLYPHMMMKRHYTWRGPGFRVRYH